MQDATLQNPMASPACVVETLSVEAQQWLAEARSQVAADAARSVPICLPQLPRRIGRSTFTTGLFESEDRRVDLGSWRRCDAAALLLLESACAAGDAIVQSYWRGDLEEKAMVLRTMACRPIDASTVTLLGEAQRTNNVDHFAAAVCDSNLLARARQHESFGVEGANRMLLKLAFLDLPLERVLDAGALANPELSRMLQDLATEREAAGRRAWRDTNLMIARAPTAGTVARLAGGLEHGDEAHRLSAARGLRHLRDSILSEFARERLGRERVAEIRDALCSALESRPPDRT